MTRTTTRRAALAALASLGLGAALTVFAPFASAQSVADIKKKGEITIGMLVDFPPYGTTNAQNQPDGYDADVARLLAKDWGVKANIVPVTGPNRIPYLLTNKIDVLIATFGITAERAKQVLFSNPYSALTIYVLAPKGLKIAGPEDLKSVSIGVARASTQDTAITKIAPQGTEIKRFDDDATALQALISGQVQALGASNTILAQLNKDYAKMEIEPKITLKAQANGMAFRKSDTALHDYANKFIDEIVKNGELSKINERWFGTKLEKLPPMPKL